MTWPGEINVKLYRYCLKIPSGSNKNDATDCSKGRKVCASLGERPCGRDARQKGARLAEESCASSSGIDRPAKYGGEAS